MGSSKTGIRHLIQNNVAWKNKANGFYANHSTGGNTWYNNTSFQNGTQYNMMASIFNSDGTRQDGVILTGSKVHIMRNNIGYPNKNEYITGYGVDTAFNTWDLNITPAAKDFLSIIDPSLTAKDATVETTAGALGPRQADGSLPNVDFLKLAAGSQMIDKGTDVGLPFVGAAPDLGAYEYGATGSAGASGSGGATGSGGAAASGGTTGTGGRAGGGGITGSSGAPGSGGRSGGGGTTVVGGAAGSGGGTAIAGAPGTGGSTIGGATGSGGTAATGGRTGSAGTGGAVATGGVVSTGGVSTGGTVATGGAMATGGSSASGGVSSTGPVRTGGVPATGGSPGSGSPGGTTTSTGTTQASSGGCSCRIAGPQTARYPGLALFALLMVARRLRRRR